MTLKKLFGGIFAMSMALFAVSCAQGFDDEETFSGGVSNSQVESPTLSAESFKTVVNADGSESIQVSWPVVFGAGGYQCNVAIVDDPANPVEIYNDVVDGTRFAFPKAEDTKYEVSVLSLGNKKYNNTDAAAATKFDFSTLVPAQKIPNGADIAAFVNENLLDQDEEQAFELEAGGYYELNSVLDFGRKAVTFRGDKVNRPIVKLGYDGVIRTAAGLKIKFINFNCEEANAKGVIEATSDFYPELESQNFGGPEGAAYILPEPIVIQECMFREVKRCFFYSGTNAWGISDIRVMDSIIQLNNDGTSFGDAAVFCTYSGTCYFRDTATQKWGTSNIRNITVKNSTIYNTKGNSKNRMIRFNANQLSKCFDSQYGGATFENCTISQIMTNKEFANNTPNRKEYTITFNNNVCYDCYRLQKFIQGNNTVVVDKATNALWGVTNPVDNTDKSKWGTEEEFAFEGDHTQPLDLSQPNGGINLKATGALSSTVGDPRWL